MNNLCLYHKLLAQFCPWFPDKRITRMRNLAWLVVGLYLSASADEPWFLVADQPGQCKLIRLYRSVRLHVRPVKVPRAAAPEFTL